MVMMIAISVFIPCAPVAKLEFFKNLYEPPFDDPHVQVETKVGKQTKFTIRCSYGRNENESVLASSASGATP